MMPEKEMGYPVQEKSSICKRKARYFAREGKGEFPSGKKKTGRFFFIGGGEGEEGKEKGPGGPERGGAPCRREKSCPARGRRGKRGRKPSHLNREKREKWGISSLEGGGGKKKKKGASSILSPKEEKVSRSPRGKKEKKETTRRFRPMEGKKLWPGDRWRDPLFPFPTMGKRKGGEEK